MKLTYKTITTLFFLTFFLNVQAQKFELFTDIIAGLPLSSSLKGFHEELANQIPLTSLETIDNFDYNYGFTIGMRFKGRASVFFSNRVSGAKSSVADFSGSVNLTNELNGYTFGLEYEKTLKEYTKSNLNLGLKGLVTLSNLFLISESKIQNEIQEDKLDFKSVDYGISAGLNYEYPLKFITFRAHLDLDIYLGGKIKLKEDNSDGFLKNENGNKVTTGWTSFSGGIGFIIPLVN